MGGCYLRQRTGEFLTGRRWRRRRRWCSISTVEAGGRRKGSPAARILRIHDSVGFAIIVALAVAGTVGDSRTAALWICFVNAGHGGSGSGRGTSCYSRSCG